MSSPSLYEVAVKAIITDGSDRVLGLKRHSHVGDLFWDLPGGRLSDGEDLIEALRRELYQEIGFEGPLPADPVLRHAELWSDPDYDGPAKVLLYYELEIGALIGDVKLSDEHDGWGWLSPATWRSESEHDGARLEPALCWVLERALE